MTERGIHLRLCRSIQVEGAFGLLKNDFGFRRFLTRGKGNIRTELFLLALAFDLKKLWMKREQGRLQTRVVHENDFVASKKLKSFPHRRRQTAWVWFGASILDIYAQIFL